VAGRQDSRQDVGAAKGWKRRAIQHGDDEQSQSAQVAKDGGVIDRTPLGTRRKAGGDFEKS
jgi:hypothetical protein